MLAIGVTILDFLAPVYGAKKYGQAAKAYEFARDKADSDALKEKAIYKLGWSLFQLKKYPDATKEFTSQVAAFPEGPLAGDGQFMKGECAFQACD